ncbi:ACP S-malonyltransferase [Massilia sp. DJPM01]|uniref:ACP S-malonyltransferase n=1 Tax=Massilia sp. DJPM01 TaxID=3024404 RepID=UPI00259EC7ED|nr:ACP S-malonyltransferase [Massilia sp. DJPM01]MDM5176110.1 ACP S-malonyltransferase [Massilia sp. DJPM01]
MTRKIVFLLSGQGSQYYQMGQQLYSADSVFRRYMDELDQIAVSMCGYSVTQVLYGGGKGKAAEFSRTIHTHPAIFMLEFSLAQALMARGIKPDYLFGSSLGEFVAAALAGVAAPEAILRNVIHKAHSVERLCEPGAMLTILHDPALYRLDPVLNRLSTLAGINYDKHFVVSGTRANLETIYRHLQDQGIAALKLPISHGFHSPAMDASHAEVHSADTLLSWEAPKIPMISCLLGGEVKSISQDYFWQVGRQPILFREALTSLLDAEHGAVDFVDIGPSGTLAGFVKQHLRAASEHRTFIVMSPFMNEVDGFAQVVNELGTHAAGNILSGETTQMIAYVFPGQGAQKKGMGQELFAQFPDLLAQADALLGYSLKDLCLNDPRQQLDHTLYTQPALYVVNALSYLAERAAGGRAPTFVAGHSLGEYSALFAAGMVDFETGLKLVQKRAALMAQATAGAMAAVIGLDADTIRGVLAAAAFKHIDIANFNTPSQIVISGARDEILAAKAILESTAGCRTVVPLPVSGAFHSRLMEQAKIEFERFLAPFTFLEPAFPVISNVSARPYDSATAKALLAQQISHSVNWVASVCYMWGQGVEEFKELGPGKVLTGLIAKIKAEASPLLVADTKKAHAPARSLPDSVQVAPVVRPVPAAASERISAASLGSAQFKADYGLAYAYVGGAMVHGIASEAMVIRMARAGMLAYFGTGALSAARVEQAILQIQRELKPGQAYGMNLLNGSREEAIVELLLKHQVRNVEASAYMQITSGLVLYRLRGLEQMADGTVAAKNRIMAKLSRPEIAAGFLSPAPDRLVQKLLQQGLITTQQAQWSRQVPMADDICVEADSGGHTDSGVAAALLPAIQRQRDAAMASHRYSKYIRVGSAGGIGTPEAAAAAFILGADFIVTGSINQCTVEAGTSDAVKNLLQDMDVQDTDYAPAGDMFELGARVQVLKRGIFFPVRANKLYDVYRAVESIEQIDEKTAKLIQEKYFQRSFSEVYEECKRYHPAEQIAQAEQNPKKKMALIFRWYFGHSNRLALLGDMENKVDFQIHCGPALGAFNQWVRGTALEDWRKRHVDAIGVKLMDETATLLTTRFAALLGKAVAVQPAATRHMATPVTQ